MRGQGVLRWLVMLCAGFGTAAWAQEIGHYNGGVYDIRDFFVPEQPGFYGLVYNYYYTTDRLNNGSGNKINSIGVPTPSGPVNVGVDVNLNMYALSPMIMWVAPCKILGARYGAYVAPLFANNSMEADLTIGERTGGALRNASFAPGDLFVQPVWLDWGWSQCLLCAGGQIQYPDGCLAGRR